MAERAQMLQEMIELDQLSEHIETPCGDGRMKWRIWGSGEPIVLLHGARGSWLHWQHNISELSKHYRLIVPDMPGFGESDVVLPLESPEAHAAVIAKGVKQIVPGRRVSFVGFSAGAFMACHIDVGSPDVVQRIIMVDAGGLGTPMRFANFVSMRGLSPEEVWEANRKNLAAFMYHDPDRIDDAAIVMTIREAPRARSKFVSHIVPDKLLAIARQVHAPIDLIWGEFDFPHPDPDANAEAVRAFQPEAELRVVADAGHWSIGEQPERFNAAVLDLLAKPPQQRIV